MSYLYYIGVGLLICFEIANVYLIMPMPGSQKMNSIEVAYFLYTWRWLVRGVAITLVLIGFTQAWKKGWILTAFLSISALVVIYQFNFPLSADVMFKQPKELVMAVSQNNVVPGEKLVIGINHKGEKRAYPIQYIAYHHQVIDNIGDERLMVTYCSVCRTGRVFEPIVNGQLEDFRLVGMDHFNAMFEDKSTKSWWRQANGEAIIGELNGYMLPEIPAMQVTLATWLKFYPYSQIMQPDSTFAEAYGYLDDYDSGIGMGELVGTDTLSWNEKSWVVGVKTKSGSKAFDWNELKKERAINDMVGNEPVLIVLASDTLSFFAYRRVEGRTYSIANDTIRYQDEIYGLNGEPFTDETYPALDPVSAYQEFWHSWRTFNPDTERAN